MRKLIIKLTESDLHRIIKDSICQVITETIRYKLPRLLYYKAPIAARQSIINNGVEFKEGSDEYGGRSVGAYYNGNEVGYLNYYICYPDDIYSNISDSIEDGDNIAYDVVRRLDNNKRVIDLADIDVGKDFRNMGISKRLLEYVLSKYGGYQFYLRVCPTDGVDEATLANSVMKYGFIKVGDSDDGGTFLIRK
jgi:GNAT superfamily N-acetyltransferase